MSENVETLALDAGLFAKVFKEAAGEKFGVLMTKLNFGENISVGDAQAVCRFDSAFSHALGALAARDEVTLQDVESVLNSLNDLGSTDIEIFSPVIFEVIQDLQDAGPISAVA